MTRKRISEQKQRHEITKYLNSLDSTIYDDYEPTIYRTEYSFQYQHPADRFYFRFDHHPLKGDPATHPRYHLHSASWSLETGRLQAVPRYDYFEIDLPHVLRLIERDFFTRPI